MVYSTICCHDAHNSCFEKCTVKSLFESVDFENVQYPDV